MINWLFRPRWIVAAVDRNRKPLAYLAHNSEGHKIWVDHALNLKLTAIRYKTRRQAIDAMCWAKSYAGCDHYEVLRVGKRNGVAE